MEFRSDCVNARWRRPVVVSVEVRGGSESQDSQGLDLGGSRRRGEEVPRMKGKDEEDQQKQVNIPTSNDHGLGGRYRVDPICHCQRVHGICKSTPPPRPQSIHHPPHHDHWADGRWERAIVIGLPFLVRWLGLLLSLCRPPVFSRSRWGCGVGCVSAPCWAGALARSPCSLPGLSSSSACTEVEGNHQFHHHDPAKSLACIGGSRTTGWTQGPARCL